MDNVGSNQLRRRLGVSRGLSLAFALILGSGLLGLPGMTIERWGAQLPLAGWILTMLLVLPLIFVFTALGLANPTADGLTRYGEIAFGRVGKFALTYLITGSFCLGVPFIGIVCASYVQKTLGLPTASIPWIAIGAFWIVTAMNLQGLRLGAGLNHLAFFSLLGVLAVIVGCNGPHLWRGLQELPALSVPHLWPQLVPLRDCSLVLFWAFIGWEELSFALEEFHDPQRTIPRVYWGSFVIVCAAYLALALTASGAQLNGVSIAGTNALTALVPSGTLTVAASVAILVIALANANSNVFAYSRLVFAAGRDGVLPSFLGKLSGNAIPRASLVTLTLVYSLVILLVEGTGIAWSSLVSLVDHNFVLLYFITIVAFLRTVTGARRYVLGIPALAACVFLLSGEHLRFAYPAALVLAGWVAYRRNRTFGTVE